MATPDASRKRTWRFRLNDATTLEVSTPPPATEKQVRRRGRWSLILGTLIAALMVSAVAGAAVWTDQQDYAPGSVVTISGDNSNDAGYLAGETVVVEVSGPNGYEASCEAIADENGAWSCQVTLWDSELAEGDYSYTATGLTSGVSETGSFADHGTSPVGAANYSISANATHLVTVSVDLSGAGGTTTFPAATAKVANQTDGGTIDVVLTSPVSPGNGTWSGSFQGACGKTYKINNVVVTWNAPSAREAAHDHDSIETPGGTVDVTTNACPSANSAPVVTGPGNQTAFEGTSKSFSLGSFTDAGPSPWNVTVAWGDSSTNTTFQVSSAGSLGFQSHTYADNGTYTVTVTVADSASTPLSGSATFDVVVSNVAPFLTSVACTPCVIDEGGSTTISGTFTDPGVLDTHTVTIVWGDGSTDTVLLAANVLTFSAPAHTYVDDNPSGTSFDYYGIDVTVTDKDGGSSDNPDPLRSVITVNNVAPSNVSASFGSPISCSTTTNTAVATLSFSFADPGADTWDAKIDWDYNGVDFDNVQTVADVGKTGSTATHPYITGGVHTAAIKILDDDGGLSDIATATVTVNYNTSGILQPVNWTQAQNDPSIFKWGSTLPVKVQFFNCDGTSAGSTLSIGVTINKVTSSTPTYGVDEDIANTNSPDSGGYMRWSDPLYIYNLATKSLGGDKTATYRITLTVTSTGQKVYTNFGTREK